MNGKRRHGRPGAWADLLTSSSPTLDHFTLPPTGLNMPDPQRSAPPSPATSAPIGILLAAGRGLRFDASGVQDKLLAPLQAGPERGLPVAFVAARRMRAALSRVLAVVRPDAPLLRDWLLRSGCEVLTTPPEACGMGDSLAFAARQAPEHRAIVLALADMPSIAPATIQVIAASLVDDDSIVAPFHEGRRGHPVGFGAGHRQALGALHGDTGARVLLEAWHERLIQVPTLDAGVLRDIDTPADLCLSG